MPITGMGKEHWLCKPVASGILLTQNVLPRNDEEEVVNALFGEAQKEGEPCSPMK